MAFITYEEFPALRERFKDKKIVFTSGSFDLTHAGHARHFEACKALGDILVVAVGKDADIKLHKGDKRPILNEHLRSKMIDSLKPVDYTFLLKPPLPGTHLNSPLIEVYRTLRPDAYAVNYDVKELDWYIAHCAEAGIEAAILRLDRNDPPEFEGVSTTSIIERIRKLYS